ncbi:MAG: alpha/beta fold hydrolase, partial [Rudaea sp.]
MPELQIGDVNLHYEVTGEGQPLLFIHGLGSSTRDWELQVPEFAKSYRVITLDLRGHGQSGKPAEAYSMSLFAEDTARLLQSLGIDSAHVVGLSLGGGVAFQLAIDYPALVKTLTIVNSGPFLTGSVETDRQVAEERVGIVRQHGMRAMGQMLSERLL